MDCRNLEPFDPTCNEAAWILLDHLSSTGNILECVLCRSVSTYPYRTRWRETHASVTAKESRADCSQYSSFGTSSSSRLRLDPATSVPGNRRPSRRANNLSFKSPSERRTPSRLSTTSPAASLGRLAGTVDDAVRAFWNVMRSVTIASKIA